MCTKMKTSLTVVIYEHVQHYHNTYPGYYGCCDRWVGGNGAMTVIIALPCILHKLVWRHKPRQWFLTLPICFAHINYATPKPVYDIHDMDEALTLLKNLTHIHVSTNQSGCNSFHQMAIYKCEILYRF